MNIKHKIDRAKPVTLSYFDTLKLTKKIKKKF